MRGEVTINQDRLFIWLCAFVPATVFWLTTPWGIGISTDSVRYLEMARTIQEAQPLSNLGTHFPPFYPYLISVFGAFSDTLVDAARLLQFLLVYLCAAMAGMIVYKLSGGSRIAGLLIILALTLRWDMFFLMHFAWSESLFLTLLLGHYLLMLRWHTHDRTAYLAIAGLLLGLACLTRYAAIPFVVVSVLAVLAILMMRKSGQIFRRLGVFLAGTLIPPLAFGIIMFNLGVSSATREPGFKGLPVDKLQDATQVIGYWFGHGHGLIAGSLLAGFIVLAGILYFKNADRVGRIWVLTFALSIAGYIGFVVFVLLYVDAHVELHTRILLPAFILFMLVLGSVTGYAVVHGRMLKKTAGLCVLLFFATGSMLPMHSKAISRITHGEGFSNAHLKNLDIWKLKDAYKDKRIVTNGPELIKIHMQRDAAMVPLKYNAVTGESTPDYDRQMQQLKQRVLSGETAVFYFKVVEWREYLPRARDMRKLLQRNPVFSDEDSIVFSIENANH